MDAWWLPVFGEVQPIANIVDAAHPRRQCGFLRLLTLAIFGMQEASRRRRVFLELLEVSLLDLPHHGFAAEQIGFELRGDLAGHGEKLIADHLRKRDRSARGNEMGSPLKHKTGIPED